MAHELAYFTSFRLPEQQLPTIQGKYLQWLLGLGQYSKKRDGRKKMGVREAWTLEQVRTSRELQGEDDFELSSRAAPGKWLLRYRHRMAENQAVFFEHMIQIEEQVEGLQVQHGIRRSAPRDQLTLLRSFVRPSVIEDLIKGRTGPAPTPRNLDRELQSLDEGDVGPFVSNVLFDHASVPWVLISPSEETGQPVVEPRSVAIALRGMAAIGALKSREATFELTHSLKVMHADERLRCFDGVLRVYDGSRNADGLPFVVPEQLESPDVNERTWTAVAYLARRLSARSMPAEFFSFVEAEDERHRVSEAVALKSRIAQSTMTVEQLQESQALLTEAFVDIDKLNARIGDMAEEAQQRDRKFDKEQERFDKDRRKLKYEVQAAREEAQRRRDAASAAALSLDLRAKVAMAVRDPASSRVADYLELIGGLYSDRLVVLPSALGSAKRAAAFKWPEKAAELLFLLAGEYYNSLLSGKGDVEARGVFGADYAAKESDTLSNTGEKLRTFSYGGAEVLMERHLRCGNNKFSDAECLRIHFDWDSEKKLIVIGHCGVHLDP